MDRLKIGERKTVDSPVAQAEHSVSISDTAAPAESARSTTSTAADSAGEGPASVASEPAVPAAAVGVQIVPPGQPVDAAAWVSLLRCSLLIADFVAGGRDQLVHRPGQGRGVHVRRHQRRADRVAGR